jgi:hypothetical protein
MHVTACVTAPFTALNASFRESGPPQERRDPLQISNTGNLGISFLAVAGETKTPPKRGLVERC